MEQHQYSSNATGTSASGLPTQAAVAAPNQLQQPAQQQNGKVSPPTLPPLQQHQASPPTPATQATQSPPAKQQVHQNHQGLNNQSTMQTPSVYGSHPQTPRTPSTPNTPQSTNMSSYPQAPKQAAGRGSYSQMMSSNYPQGHTAYATSSSMLAQSSAAVSHAQQHAAAPSSRPPVLRPMPAGSVMPGSSLSSYGQSAMMAHHQASLVPHDNDQPTHVVGSQGRRGILPSAPGRPAAPTGSGASRNTVIPQKDADGKYPCAHCTKTYLHAKHLKRHLLRHTGDRPYMCVLCRDTFSRSDILKRHFQKCSIRRGNPTGASHLSHPQAHVRKHIPKVADSGMNHMNGLNGIQGGDGVVPHPFNIVPMTESMGNMANDQSRSSSMGRMEDGNNRDRRGLAGNSVYNGDGQNGMTSNLSSQMGNYMPGQGQNGMPMFGQSDPSQQNLGWSMFSQGGAPQSNVCDTPPNLGQTQVGTVKPEPRNFSPVTGSGLSTESGGTAATASNDTGGQSHKVRPMLVAFEELSQLSTHMRNYLFATGTTDPDDRAAIDLLTIENTASFLVGYTFFHTHFPILHLVSLQYLATYPGLPVAMCCIGAVYSHAVVDAADVRKMMDVLKVALERDTGPLASGSHATDENNRSAVSTREIEKLQALALLHMLLTWNGTAEHRDEARRLFPTISGMARKCGLLEIRTETLHSVLHQPDYAHGAASAGDFDWSTWVEQEKRVRLMHLIFCNDVAQTLYFNASPHFECNDLQIPLPADDAAWDAQDVEACRTALHLHGSEAAKVYNPNGSQRSKQPEAHLIMRALFSNYSIEPASTNLLGKFVMVHCLMAQIRRTLLDGSLCGVGDLSSPLPQNDWAVWGGADSANNCDRTPVFLSTPCMSLSPDVVQTIHKALQKFKASWDMDLAIQYPRATDKREGFSRDGIHFYYIALWLLDKTQPADLQRDAEGRFEQTVHALKTLKAWAKADDTSNQYVPGAASLINAEYASQLTVPLDMAGLFQASASRDLGQERGILVKEEPL